MTVEHERSTNGHVTYQAPDHDFDDLDQEAEQSQRSFGKVLLPLLVMVALYLLLRRRTGTDAD